MFAPPVPKGKAGPSLAAAPVNSREALHHKGAQTLDLRRIASTAAGPSFRWEFSRISAGHGSEQVQGSPLFFTAGLFGHRQPKLEIGPADDPLEHEADRVAEAVVSGGAGLAADRVTELKPIAASTGLRRAMHWRDPPKRGELAPAHEALEQLTQSPSGGEALPDPVRSRIENVVGADLSDVRVHRDSASGRASALINARAFTHGNHIWLGEGQSPSDTRLIAHEAAHVVQQRAVPHPTPVIQRDIVSMTIRGEGESGLEKQDSGQWYRSLGDDFGSIQKGSTLGFQGGFKDLPYMVLFSTSYALGLWKVEAQVLVDSVENKKGQQELVKFKATLSNLIAYIQNKDGGREGERSEMGAIGDGPSGQNWQGTTSFYAFDAPRWGGYANQGKTYFVSGDWTLRATHGATAWQGGYHIEFSFTDSAPASGSGKFAILEEPHPSAASPGP